VGELFKGEEKGNGWERAYAKLDPKKIVAKLRKEEQYWKRRIEKESRKFDRETKERERKIDTANRKFEKRMIRTKSLHAKGKTARRMAARFLKEAPGLLQKLKERKNDQARMMFLKDKVAIVAKMSASEFADKVNFLRAVDGRRVHYSEALDVGKQARTPPWLAKGMALFTNLGPKRHMLVRHSDLLAAAKELFKKPKLIERWVEAQSKRYEKAVEERWARHERDMKEREPTKAEEERMQKEEAEWRAEHVRLAPIRRANKKWLLQQTERASKIMQKSLGKKPRLVDVAAFMTEALKERGVKDCEGKDALVQGTSSAVSMKLPGEKEDRWMHYWFPNDLCDLIPGAESMLEGQKA